MYADEIPFLNALFHSPKDEVPRLIYADWLEERGDARSEFLRLEVDLSHPRGKRKRRNLESKMRKQSQTIDSWWTALITNIRYKHPDVVQEFCWLDNGAGLLDVIGGDGETALLLEGKPVAFNWNDDPNGYAQFLLVTVHQNFQQLVPQVDEITSGMLDRNRTLFEQLRPLISVFRSGLYAIIFTPSQTVKNWAQVIVNNEMQNYIPLARNLVCTQPQASLNWPKVRQCRAQTHADQQPIVVTTSVMNARCEFVIAGHHELEGHTGSPAVMRIERCDAPPISLELGVGLLPDEHPGIAEYRRMKELQTAGP